MRPAFRYLLTAAVVLAAIAAVAVYYRDYLRNPWTRDGQIMADVIQVAPRVSGPIVELPIRDNQRVKTGDVLFQIDPRTFQSALDEAQANYDRTLNDVEVLTRQVEAAAAGLTQADSVILQAESQVKAEESTRLEAEKTLIRNAALLETGDVALASKREAEAALAQAMGARAQAAAQLAEARADLGAPGPRNERIRAAAAQLESARLDFEFTTVKATRDGFVTNLDLRIGSQAVANRPMLALIDERSFWIDAYFRETLVADIRPGDRAVVTLMSHPDMPFEGVVESLAWGISKQDGSTGVDLLQSVEPTFQWIRLAQRIPVRIELGDVPEGVILRVGQTASVLVHKGDAREPVAAPAALQ